jgi:hypothetical protein
MTTESAKHAKPAETTASAQLERLGTAGGAFADAVMKSSQACLDGMSRVGGEVAGFVNDRLQRDVDFGQSLARCGTWAEAASLQQDWARRAVQDYFSESGKLLQLMSKATLESMDTVLRTTASGLTLIQPRAETRKH